jgi:hypothetical protein
MVVYSISVINDCALRHACCRVTICAIITAPHLGSIVSWLLVCAIHSLLSRVRHPCTRSPRSSCSGRDTRAARGRAVRQVWRRARRRSVGPSRNSRPKWMPQSALLQTPSVPQHRFDSRPRSPAYHSSEAPWAACRCPGCAEGCDVTRDRDTDTAAVSICPIVTMDLKFRHQGF